MKNLLVTVKEKIAYRPQWPACRAAAAAVFAELSMGPFCVTRPNQTNQLTDPTQPTTNEKKFGPNPSQPNTNCH